MKFIKANCNHNSFFITCEYIKKDKMQHIFNKAMDLDIDGIIFITMDTHDYDYKMDYYL